jgi:hypothetical protein
MKILYIAGYGRSGSTVLDIVLGSHRDIVGVGEVGNLLEDWADARARCSCTRAYADCPFWQGLFDGAPDPKLFRTIRRVETLASLPRLLLGLIPGQDREMYRRYHDHLFKHVASRAGKTIVLDSSKSARATVGRFLALSRLAGQDVYVLHLVRDGLATMESVVATGSNRAIEGRAMPQRTSVVRATLGWASANLWAWLLGRSLGRGRYMRLHYETLVSDPAETIRQLATFLGVDPRELLERIAAGDSFEVGHLVAGNRLRWQGKVRLDPRHLGRKGTLSRHQRVVFLALAGWLAAVLRPRRRRLAGWRAGKAVAAVTETRRSDGRPTGVDG